MLKFRFFALSVGWPVAGLNVPDSWYGASLAKLQRLRKLKVGRAEPALSSRKCAREYSPPNFRKWRPLTLLSMSRAFHVPWLKTPGPGEPKRCAATEPAASKLVVGSPHG